MNLITDAELAETMSITVEKLHELRKRHGWPHVRLGRFEIRFTDVQVEQIVAAQTVAPAKGRQDEAGLTPRSAARRRAS